MKSSRKKRILATILCMVMVLTSNISALAEGDGLPDMTEQGVTAASVPETPEQEPEVPGGQTQQTSVDSSATVPTTPEVTPETTPVTTSEVTPTTTPETTPGATTTNETPGSDTPANSHTAAGTGKGVTGGDDTTTTVTTPETTVPTPEVTPEETGDVFSEATELTQEFKDAQGRVVQKVTAKLPAGAFAAETSHITMEVQYLDEASENHIKNLMTKQLPQGDELGDYIALSVKFKVDGVETEALQPITITFEKSGLEIKDVKKANVFYYDPADPTVAGDQDELVEITQRNEMIENLQAAGQSTDNIEDYDLSSIEIKEENRSEKIQFEGRKSTIYGCYVEKTPEEVPADIPVLNYEDDKVTVSVTAEEAGIIPEGAELKVVPITSEDTETKEQYQEVEKKIQEKVAEEEKEVAGFLAYDITFVDKDGNEMEPNGKVKVSMNYKKAELPQEVVEKEATDAEVTVLHLEEDENGEVKQVVDMGAEQKANVDTLTTTEGAKVQNVEVETESFSVFTITWKYNVLSGPLKVTCQYATMDEEGNINEIEVKDVPSDININQAGEIKLDTYGKNVKGYTFRNAIIQKSKGWFGAENVKVTTLKATYKEGTYKIQYKDESGYQDWLSSQLFEEKEGTVYFIYDKIDSLINIKDSIITDGSLTAVLADSLASEGATYQWYKSDSENGTYELVEKISYQGGKENISSDGTKLYPAYDKGARKWYKVKVTFENGDSEESEPYQVPYYDELQNGSFETPAFDERRAMYQRENEDYARKGVWRTTGIGVGKDNNGNSRVGRDIEILHEGNNSGYSDYAWAQGFGGWQNAAPDGKQFAEINCEVAGALYQDVLTIDGQALNFWLSHRARGNHMDREEYDEMYLVIVPTKLALEKNLNTQKELEAFLGEYGITIDKNSWNSTKHTNSHVIRINNEGVLIMQITSNDQMWHTISEVGKYIPTASLSRFFFMAGATASGDDSVGNFIDNVDFSQKLPKPEDGKFNFTIEKHFEGLGDAELKQLRDKIQFRISVKNNETELSEEEVKTLLGIDDVVIKGSDMTPDLYGNLSKAFVDRPITNSNNVYEITVTEENAELASYKVTASYTTEVSQDGGKAEVNEGDGATATVLNIKGKTGATISFTNTYESTNYKNVNFTKVWDDKGGTFDTRPENLEVTLHGSVSYVDETGNTVAKELTAEELGVDTTRTLNEAGEWKTSWRVPVYYEVAKADGTTAKIKIHYTVTEGTINSDYVYEAGEIQSGNGKDYKTDSFDDVTITGDGKAVTQPATKRMSKGRSLLALPGENENTLGEPNHRKYITYNEATGDYTLNLDVTGRKGEAKGVDVLFVIDTSGSMADYNLLQNVKDLLTKEDGVVDKILGGENNVNSVAYVSFAGKDETKTTSWYGQNSINTFKEKINNLRATGGTNWTYAMMKANEKLAERANNSNEKVMIFLSDGEPTYSINSEGKQYGRGNSPRDVYYTEAIAQVTGSSSLSSAQKYSVYLTGVTKDGMTRFANGTGAELVDGTQLQTALEGILNKIIPTYENVSITDTLTEYVEFSEETNPTVTVYKDNTALNQSAYTLSISGKKVRVSFNDDLEDGSTYRISFRVKTSQAANEHYSKNGVYPNTGDAGTGTTSAGEKGFYSNTEATLTYSVKGTTDQNLTATYKKPVVQVTTHSLTFEKKWNKPENATVPTSVTLNVAYTDGTNEEITLTANNNWTVTKDNIPVTKKIQSVAEKALNDYTPSYEISADGTKATVTNSYSKIITKNMTVRKTWSGNGPKSAVTVNLYQRKNDNSAEKIYESVVLDEKNDWTCTWNNLPSVDWAGGTNFSYAVREEKIPENYTSNITYETSGDTTTVTINNVYDINCADESYYIANKLQTIPLTVTKTWSDGNNVQGERPTSLGVTVTEGDHELQFTLSEENNWTKNVKVPKRNDSNYTATEDLTGITNYEQTDSSVNATDNAIYVSFTNQIKTTSITVNKVWVDGTLENRPGSIEFVLKRNGEVYDHYTLSEEDNDGNGNSWTKVIEGLPVTGTYTVEEVGWGTDESDTTYDYNSKVTGFTITNTLNWHIIKTSESLAGEATVNLEGAEFELKKDNQVIGTGTSDSNGVVQWKGNSDLTSLDGEYQLVETKAPNGYVIHEEGWTLTFEDGLLKSVKDNKDNAIINASYDAEKGACVTITNTKLYELPETGGTGIFVYTIGGTLLLMAAALLIYKMKREEVLKG